MEILTIRKAMRLGKLAFKKVRQNAIVFVEFVFDKRIISRNIFYGNKFRREAASSLYVVFRTRLMGF